MQHDQLPAAISDSPLLVLPCPEVPQAATVVDAQGHQAWPPTTPLKLVADPIASKSMHQADES